MHHFAPLEAGTSTGFLVVNCFAVADKMTAPPLPWSPALVHLCLALSKRWESKIEMDLENEAQPVHCVSS